MKFFEDNASDSSSEKYTLTVYEFNPGAKKFYCVEDISFLLLIINVSGISRYAVMNKPANADIQSVCGVVKHGRNGARTRDLPRVRRTLSQLSYTP